MTDSCIPAGYEALDEELDATVRVDAKRIVAAGRERSGRTLRPWRWPAMVPAWAAAGVGVAAVGAALLFGISRQPAVELAYDWQPPPPAPSQPVVTAPNHNVAVIHTDNPDITIFWFWSDRHEP